MKPWTHQNEIVSQLLGGNYLLFWETGTGKTFPLVKAASLRGGRALYLGPPAIRTQVAREAVRYGFYQEQDIQIIGAGKDVIRPDAKLVVCSYDHLYEIGMWKQMYALEWETLILDEGHLLKNTQAKRTRAVYGAKADSKGALVRRAKVVWVATGTPIVNDPMDLWSHVSRLFPNVCLKLNIKNKFDWMHTFCTTQVTPWAIKVTGGKNMDLLRQSLEPYNSRVRKEDVLDLPPLLVSELWVPPAEIDLTGVPPEALQELQRLLAEEKDFMALAAPLTTLRRRIGLAKAGHVADMVINELDAGEHVKILVFYHHVTVGDELVLRITRRPAYRDAVLQYEGGLPQGKRDELVRAFSDDPSKRVLIAQIQAAGTGLNLQACNRVYIVEPPWTPAAIDQAISRVYRGGQKESCYVSLVCLAHSVDTAVTSALKKKLTIIKGVIQQ